MEHLKAQIELGGFEVYFDESLSASNLSLPSTPPKSTPTVEIRKPIAEVVKPEPLVPELLSLAVPTPVADLGLPLMIPSIQVQDNLAEIESSKTLSHYNEQILHHPLYRISAGSQERIAFGDGPSQPSVLLVSYMASPDDVRTGGFLTGAAAELLRKVLESLHISRNLCYATHFIKKPSASHPMPRQILAYKRMLMTEIKLVKPKLVLLLGELTLQAMVGKSFTLENNGGEAMELDGIPMTAIHDPEAMLTNPALKVLTWKSHLPRSGFFDMTPLNAPKKDS